MKKKRSYKRVVCEPTVEYLMQERQRLFELLTKNEDRILNDFRKLLQTSDLMFEMHDIVLEVVSCHGLNADPYECNTINLIFEPVSDKFLSRLCDHLHNILITDGFSHKTVEIVSNCKFRVIF